MNQNDQITIILATIDSAVTDKKTLVYIDVYGMGNKNRKNAIRALKRLGYKCHIDDNQYDSIDIVVELK